MTSPASWQFNHTISKKRYDCQWLFMIIFSLRQRKGLLVAGVPSYIGNPRFRAIPFSHKPLSRSYWSSDVLPMGLAIVGWQIGKQQILKEICCNWFESTWVVRPFSRQRVRSSLAFGKHTRFMRSYAEHRSHRIFEYNHMAYSYFPILPAVDFFPLFFFVSYVVNWWQSEHCPIQIQRSRD
jgi:hypothetical protein